MRLQITVFSAPESLEAVEKINALALTLSDAIYRRVNVEILLNKKCRLRRS